MFTNICLRFSVCSARLCLCLPGPRYKRAWAVECSVVMYTDLLLEVVVVVVVEPLAGVQQHGARHHSLADVVPDLEVRRQQRLEYNTVMRSTSCIPWAEVTGNTLR